MSSSWKSDSRKIRFCFKSHDKTKTIHLNIEFIRRHNFKRISLQIIPDEPLKASALSKIAA